MADTLKKDRSAIQLGPMEVPKASDVLANELRERILTGEFTENTPLPPERELVTQTRMSRSTVREALRILEVQGLVRIKAGRAGGAFVQRPSKEAVATSVSLVIRGQQIRLAALLETREAIEPFCAQLAARYRTADDLKVLDAANEAIADENSTLAAFL
ncbi:FadR/GntR family transcriptional regulator, partial [Candidatus Protofrankia californiensis]|uniref:FadR/GntR family transcriptional regulator n=2 Tax=Protofrankia TaxID=2994361 RepID=UPI00104181C4